MPQMADTDALFAHFAQPDRKPARTRLSGLVLNEKGMERGVRVRRRVLLHGRVGVATRTAARTPA